MSLRDDFRTCSSKTLPEAGSIPKRLNPHHSRSGHFIRRASGTCGSALGLAAVRLNHRRHLSAALSERISGSDTKRLLNGPTNPVLRSGGVDACSIVAREAHPSAVTRHSNDALLRASGTRIGVVERRRARVAIADDARKRPAGPFVVDNLPQRRKLDAAESVPFGHGRRHPAMGSASPRVEEAVARNRGERAARPSRFEPGASPSKVHRSGGGQGGSEG